ncbi:MAG: D-aminoacyl-tRNA deacylase [archaeon]|jgi:D-aminoacyl-tRNA deacylase
MEKIALVYSTTSIASLNIAKQIQELGVPPWAQMYGFDEDEINLPIDTIPQENIIVLSKHASAAGTKSFTVHALGNFNKVDFGGEEKTLVNTLAKISANLLRGLSANAPEDFSVCYEVTHHGPNSKKNICFIELGSSVNEWNNLDWAKIIAKVIIEYTLKENNDKIVIGLGGGHYTPTFTKLALRQNYSFGHICPVHNLNYLDKNLLNQMITKSGATEIILDWKGLKEHKDKIVLLCENSGLSYERAQILLKQ